ncbi:hypothetical protein CsatA_016236 [Cannabis sativa]
MTAVKSPHHASKGVGSPQSRRAPRAAGGSAWNQIVRVTLSQLGCPSLSGLVIYYVPIVVFFVFARLNGKITSRELNGEYTCVWKQDGWVPAYYALAILTMLWPLAALVEAHVFVINGIVAQWHFCKEESTLKRIYKKLFEGKMRSFSQ